MRFIILGIIPKPIHARVTFFGTSVIAKIRINRGVFDDVRVIKKEKYSVFPAISAWPLSLETACSGQFSNSSVYNGEL